MKDIKPKFRLGQTVVNTVINDYFIIREISRRIYNIKELERKIKNGR